jgi:hypothetical protein
MDTKDNGSNDVISSGYVEMMPRIGTHTYMYECISMTNRKKPIESNVRTSNLAK